MPRRPAETEEPLPAESFTDRVEAAANRRSIPLATILTTVGVVVVSGVLLLLLWVLRSEVLYVVVGGFVAVLLTPPVHFLERHGLGRGWAAAITFLVGLLAFGGIVYLFASPLVSAVSHFTTQIPNLVKQAEHGRGRLGDLIRRFHLQNWVSKNAPKLSSDITKVLKPAQALSAGAAVFSTIIALFTIAFMSFFILLEAPNLYGAVLRAIPDRHRERVARTYGEVSHSVYGYMAGNALTSIIAGTIVFVDLIAFGVPFAALLGLWVALVDLLPLVGGLIAGVPTVFIAFLHSTPAGIVTLVVFLVYQQIENHVLNPVVMSRTVRLSPLWVLLSILIAGKIGGQIGGSLGGFVGALIGIPFGGAVQVIIREVRRSGNDAVPPPGASEQSPALP